MNPLKGEAGLDLGGGRVLTLVFDYEAMIAAEATYGQPIGVVSDHADRGFVGALRALLFGTLRTRHADIDLAEATHICFAHAQAVQRALDQAAKNSMPADDGEERDEARPPRAGTRSGGSGAKRGSTPKPSSARPRGRSTSSSPRG